MAETILLLALPVFTLMVLLEAWLVKADEKILGYDGPDSRVSISMGLGSLVVNGAWRLVEAALLTAVAAVAPFHLHGWPAWLVGLVAVDLAYYWDHRVSHEVRIMWASHVVHHSSQRYNLSTALRQTWTGQTLVLFLAPVAFLGVSPVIVFAAWSINLVYQFWIHTEAIDRLWAPVEWLMNTPSHHRAHHGSNSQYLDRNYGGILIVWDRLFRSFEPEGERVRYGLTKNVTSSNLITVQTHEYRAIWQDVRGAGSLRTRLGYVLAGPGWAPPAAVTTAFAA